MQHNQEINKINAEVIPAFQLRQLRHSDSKSDVITRVAISRDFLLRRKGMRDFKFSFY